MLPGLERLVGDLLGAEVELLLDLEARGLQRLGVDVAEDELLGEVLRADGDGGLAVGTGDLLDQVAGVLARPEDELDEPDELPTGARRVVGAAAAATANRLMRPRRRRRRSCVEGHVVSVLLAMMDGRRKADGGPGALPRDADARAG